MKHRLSTYLGLVLGLVLAGSTAYSAEYLVKYKGASGFKALKQQAKFTTYGMSILDRNPTGSYVVVDLAQSNEVAMLANLVSNPNVEWVTPNFKLQAFGNANAITLKEQWSIAKVQAEKAWTRATNKGRKSVIIAVIDTGIDYRHKNLAPNMVAGYDFRNNDADPMDETGAQNPGHGTHCAGIAAATGLIDQGIVGLGPEVSLMPIRFLGSDGSGDLNSGIKSIDYAIEKGASVISASWGASVPRSQATALIEAVQRADTAGVIFVAAAANDGKSNDSTDVFPANSNTPNMITVAASGSTDAKPSWSNYGRGMVHLAAPGEKIMSTLPGDKYGELSGTSMATPLVSGLVAFLKAQDNSLTGAQIRALLQTTGAQVSIETACNCRVDAFAAVDLLLNKKQWLVPTAATIGENDTVIVSMMNAVAPVTYISSNPAFMTVDDNGVVKALAKGTATITATDAAGNSVTSLDFNVGMSAPPGGGGPGNPPGGGGDCPIGDPALCEIACQIMPDLPFCSL